MERKPTSLYGSLCTAVKLYALGYKTCINCHVEGGVAHYWVGMTKISD